MGDPVDPQTQRMLASALSRQLGHSSLRVEIVRAETTAATGMVNLTELAQVIESRLRELEALPEAEREQQSEWRGDGLHLVWRSRLRSESEANEPTVSFASP